MDNVIEWNKSNFYVIGIGNTLKEVIETLRKENYEKCEFLWIENVKDLQISSFKFIFILIDYIDFDIINKIDRFYENSNITIICSPLKIENMITKYDSFFLIERMFCPYFYELKILLHILFTPWNMSINSIDFLHFFCNGKILKISQYTLMDESEDSLDKFDKFMQDQIPYIIKGGNKILITEISSKNSIKVNGIFNNNYHKYENELENKGVATVKQYKSDEDMEDGKIRVSMLLIGKKD